jgi:hypothetical protein
MAAAATKTKPKPEAEPAPIAKAKPDAGETDEITYLPEDGDPIRTRWNGIEFKAHVPVKVSRKHTVLVPDRVEREMPDGTIQSRSVEKRIPMVELAKGNCRFMVNGVPPMERDSGAVHTPTTADEYRGYALRWIAASTEPKAMDARWTSEEALRDKCDVGDDEIAYLRPFFEARIEALGGGRVKRQTREVLMGLTREELELEARRER